DVAACLRALYVRRRRVARRRFHETGEQRGLGHRQIFRLLTEIAARRCLDAVESIAEVDLVEIQLENFRLRVQVLDLRSEDEFLNLTANCFVLRQKALTRELLRERARALRGAPVPQVGHGSERDANGVEAVVSVEVLIFDGNQRLN